MFLDFEKKTLKTQIRRPYVQFQRPLITAVFNKQLQKVSTGKSPTSNILLCRPNNVSVITQPNRFVSKASCLEILMTNPDELQRSLSEVGPM